MSRLVFARESNMPRMLGHDSFNNDQTCLDHLVFVVFPTTKEHPMLYDHEFLFQHINSSFSFRTAKREKEKKKEKETRRDHQFQMIVHKFGKCRENFAK